MTSLKTGDWVTAPGDTAPGRVTLIDGNWATVRWPGKTHAPWKLVSGLKPAAPPWRHRARHWMIKGTRDWHLQCTAPGCVFWTSTGPDHDKLKAEFRAHRARMGDKSARYPELETLACKISPEVKNRFLACAAAEGLSSSQALRLAVMYWLRDHVPA